MDLHANAKLGLAGRVALVRAVEEGRPLRAAAFSVSPATAHRWWHRWLDGGRQVGALLDRSSRPRPSPRLLAPDRAMHQCGRVDETEETRRAARAYRPSFAFYSVTRRSARCQTRRRWDPG